MVAKYKNSKLKLRAGADIAPFCPDIATMMLILSCLAPFDGHSGSLSTQKNALPVPVSYPLCSVLVDISFLFFLRQNFVHLRAFQSLDGYSHLFADSTYHPDLFYDLRYKDFPELVESFAGPPLFPSALPCLSPQQNALANELLAIQKAPSPLPRASTMLLPSSTTRFTKYVTLFRYHRLFYNLTRLASFLPSSLGTI